jgi:hypothetical protein
MDARLNLLLEEGAVEVPSFILSLRVQEGHT